MSAAYAGSGNYALVRMQLGGEFESSKGVILMRDVYSEDNRIYEETEAADTDNLSGITIERVPDKNRPPVPPIKYEGTKTDERVYRFCLLGLTDKDIAECLNITEQTLNNWKNQYPSLFESIKKGKSEADAYVAQKLFKKATGYVATERRETIDSDGKKSVTVIDKEMAPDTIAQIFWLKNRDPNRWRDKQEVENTHTIKTLQILSPEDETPLIENEGGNALLPEPEKP